MFEMARDSLKIKFDREPTFLDLVHLRDYVQGAVDEFNAIEKNTPDNALSRTAFMPWAEAVIRFLYYEYGVYHGDLDGTNKLFSCSGELDEIKKEYLIIYLQKKQDEMHKP